MTCYVDNSWTRIGYVVREALDFVHDAIAACQENQICKVTLGHGQLNQQGPGFYARLALTLQLKERGLVLFVNYVIVLGNILNNKVTIINHLITSSYITYSSQMIRFITHMNDQQHEFYQ